MNSIRQQHIDFVGRIGESAQVPSPCCQAESGPSVRAAAAAAATAGNLAMAWTLQMISPELDNRGNESGRTPTRFSVRISLRCSTRKDNKQERFHRDHREGHVNV